ncbi:MAG: hypothetical protein LBJ31_10040 [Treponema sp.]|jgi:hypothetical protein|nr:hypothetical protein [Treponema sp.]
MTRGKKLKSYAAYKRNRQWEGEPFAVTFREWLLFQLPRILPIVCTVLTLALVILVPLGCRSIHKHLDAQTELLSARLMAVEENLDKRITETSDEIMLSIGETRGDIARLNAVYTSLLDAQKRRTLDSLYQEDFLPAKLREAETAFRSGRYLAANSLYKEITDLQSDNREARFYQYYALFLSNKGAHNNYKAITDAFSTLERSGYSRRELTETLAYIEAELHPGGGQ